MAKAQQVRTAENRVSQISVEQKIDTQKELAKAAGVSHDTIAKVEKIEANASEETKEKRPPRSAGAFCRNRNGREILDRKYYNILVAHLQQKPVHHENEANRLPRSLTEKNLQHYDTTTHGT